MTRGEWLAKFKMRKLIFGECNCEECRNIKGGKDIVLDAIKDKTQLDFIPRIYDLNGQRRDFFHPVQKRDNGEWWRYVLDRLFAVHNKNIRMGYRKKEHRLCHDCGKLYRKGAGRIVEEGVHVCPNCFRDAYVKCHICGKIKQGPKKHYHPQFDQRLWGGGIGAKPICMSCYNEMFLQCLQCGMPVDEAHWYDVSRMTERVRGHRLVLREMFEDENGPMYEEMEDDKPDAVVCLHCKEHKISPCAVCGENKLHRDMQIKVYRGERARMCPDCADNQKVIKRYDYAVKPKFLTSRMEKHRPSALHFGVEIEMELANGNQDFYGSRDFLADQGREILEWWGGNELYIKHDGSLVFGFEVVSHPFTWSHFLDNRNKWTDFLLLCREKGFTSSYIDPGGRPTCGFHVHMSQDAFTSLHMYKFIEFFYKKSIRPFIIGVAGRSANQYARFENQDARHTVKMSKDKRNVSGKRYSVINLVGGHAHEHGNAPKECKTAEVRIFKGSLEPYLFHKNMEFLMSAYEFTSYNAMTDILVKKYLEHLLLKPDNWRSLVGYIKHNTDINKSYNYISEMLKGI